MKLIEAIQEILLGLSIAIMLPVVSYWGVHTFYPSDIQVVDGYDRMIETENVDQTDINKTIDVKKIQLEDKHKQTKVKEISFWVYFFSSFLAILMGSFIKINTLSMGFIGGGVLNILMCVSNSCNQPVINFVIFSFLFIALILIIITKRN